jgi:hypothetical protein
MSRLIKVKLALVDSDHLLANRYVADASGQWERKLLGMSGVSRSCTLDRSFERGGFSLEIDDTDETYKTMMKHVGNRKIKDRVVTVYLYGPDGSTVKETITATIRNWRRDEGVFTLDCVQEFSGKMAALPTDLVINSTDWPNAPAHSLGRKVEYPSGVCRHGGGCVFCWRVDNRPNGKYLITWSDPAGAARVLSIQQVYERHMLITDTGDYSLVRDASGWEYLTLDSAYKDIGFLLVNLTASASVASANNPVDYLRENLTSAGVTLVDDGDGGTEDMETFCDTNSWGVIGSLTVDSVRELLEIWCHNYDCFWRIDAAGSVHIKHLDWSSITADATMTERHFISLKEDASNEEFANRLRATFNYDFGNHKWDEESVTESVDGDYLSTGNPIERPEEYAIGSFAGAVKPMTSKIKYYDHPIHTIDATMALETYEAMGLHLLSIIDITHSNQIGDSGKYLLLYEDMDYAEGIVGIRAVRLWGV